MAVFTTATVLVPHASATEGGLDVTVLSFTAMICTTALAMANVLDQTCASAYQDFLVEAVPIPIAPSFTAV